ncbi:MAG: peptide ABC transporter substrate-binding protein [Chloroflexi bacterium]|nr:peptide ABC transporter substrate-binding protein [Chloroflexota bacterium]
MMKRLICLTVLVLLSILAGCLPTQAPPAQGVLNLEGSDPITLDPALAGDVSSNDFILQVFSGLVKLDDSLEPAPDIAERWQISPDATTYIFYLKSNVRFQSGRAVTAADFKYSWERACDPATNSKTAPIYLNDILGAKEMLAGQAKELRGVKVVNDTTLEIKIDAPRSYFLAKLTYPTAFVVDRANAQSGANWWRKPNGTGPFRLESWEENKSIVLARNDGYYGQLPGLSAVSYQLYAGIAMNLYETGKIDVAGVSQPYIDKVSDPAGPFSRELVVTPELSFSYVGFNSAKPPFDDPNIRRAFNLAIDKTKLASLVFKDMVQPAYGILPPGMPGYNPNLAGLKLDVAKAKELIASSKYRNASALPPITITVSGRGGGVPNALEALVYQWQQNLGVKVKVRQLEPERFLYNLKEEKDEMFLMGWAADYPHPQDFLEVLFHSGTESNYGEYRNAAVDALLEKAGVEPDTSRSLAMYQQAEQMLVDDAACLPLWFSKNYTLVKPYVSGYRVSPLGFTMLDKVRVER